MLPGGALGRAGGMLLGGALGRAGGMLGGGRRCVLLVGALGALGTPGIASDQRDALQARRGPAGAERVPLCAVVVGPDRARRNPA